MKVLWPRTDSGLWTVRQSSAISEVGDVRDG